MLHFSFRKTLFLALSLCLPLTAVAQVVPLVENSFGPQFYDHQSGKVFVISSGGNDVTYDSVESTLGDSGFQIANRAEALSAFESIIMTPGIDVRMGFAEVPEIFNGTGYICFAGGAAGGSCADALYDDSSTGSDPQKVGLVRFKFGQLPNRGAELNISVMDDLQDREMEPNTGAGFDRTNQNLGVLLVQSSSDFCDENTKSQMDFDCDGIDEKVVWRQASGVWFIKYSLSETITNHQWGLPGDVPIMGDYDGDGLPDLVVWRPTNGTWYVRTSNNGISSPDFIARQFGLPGDKPLRVDFDGDSILDFAVWRPSEGNFYYLRSSDETIVVEQLGLPDDIPLTAGASLNP